MENESEKSHSHCFSIVCGVITMLIVIAWSFYIFFSKRLLFHGGESGYESLILVFSHLAFLSMTLFCAIITYKVFEIQSTAEEKEKDYLRKKALEEVQKKKYDECLSEKEKEEKLTKKIENVCKGILEKWQSTYEENLKILKSNMSLYNEVKKIVEDVPEGKPENTPKKPTKK